MADLPQFRSRGGLRTGDVSPRYPADRSLWRRGTRAQFLGMAGHDRERCLSFRSAPQANADETRRKDGYGADLASPYAGSADHDFRDADFDPGFTPTVPGM